MNLTKLLTLSSDLRATAEVQQRHDLLELLDAADSTLDGPFYLNDLMLASVEAFLRTIESELSV